MRFTSASNSNSNSNNGKYEIGGLVFPSYELYDVLEKINKNLSFFCTETGEECDYEPIFDSPTRGNGEFDDVYANIKYYFSIFKNICKNDDRVDDFLYNNRLSDEFSSLFGSIYYAFIEAIYGQDDFDNLIEKKQNRKIKKIVRKLSHYGVDPFKPHVI